ncbi:MAG: hypothetical protein AB7O37_01005 [Vicinamibacteria bacterium]
MSCPLCRSRKGKRRCPAKEALICSPCCGSKRRVEVDCPEDCVYLTGEHAGEWSGREAGRERDMRRIAPFIERLDATQGQLFLVALVGLSGLRAQRRGLRDALVLDAVRAWRKTVETRAKGVLFDHAPDDARAGELLVELRGLFEAKDGSGQIVRPDDKHLLPVLAALEGALDATRRELGAPDAFLETAGRIAATLQRRAEPASKLIVAP